MRTMAVLEGRDLVDVVTGEEKAPADKSSKAYASYASKVRKERAVVVNALGDKPLRGVQLCNMPSEMWLKLWERYAGKTVANQVSVLTTLMNLKATKDTVMDDHVAQMESLIHRLASKGIAVEEPMQVAILLVSLENLREYNGMVCSIETMDPGVATRPNFTDRVIDEQKQLSESIITPTSDTDKPILGTLHGKQRSKRDIVSWNCNGKRHFARDCRKLKK